MPPLTRPSSPPSTVQPHLATLSNGLRVLALPMPWRQTVSLSVFIRTGSLHESARTNGISHVVEHMAFKGTATRDCQRINLDAERRGADMNAHTDKDHTAFHIEGLASDLPVFVDQLADIVLHSTFPADEFERERQVILHELTEVEEDPVAMAFQAFDAACWGRQHPASRPVIGRRAQIERLTRDDLLAYVRQQYTAANVVVAAAGPIDAEAFTRAVEAAFCAMPTGLPHAVPPAAWQGGLKVNRLAGHSQCHAVLGFAIPTLADDAHLPCVVAAALLGEGMSSPLLDEIRERRALAYYVGCSADVMPHSGQFVIDASTSPGQTGEFFTEVQRLLHRHAEAVADDVALQRARNQLTMRMLRLVEQPARWLESGVQDLFTFGRLRDPAATLARLRAVDAGAVRDAFIRMQATPAAVALAGGVPARVKAHAQAILDSW